MSEHEEIKRIIGELNHHKSNIVTAVKHFVNTSKDLGQKTTDKKVAENILLTAQKSEKYAAATIPDLIIPGGSTPTTGSVKIHHPANNSKHLFDTDIKLEFETKHVHLPFTYVVVGKDSAGEFLIKNDKSHHEKVLTHKIMRDNKDRLSVGMYEVSVHIVDPTTNTEIVPPDKINIEITPRAVGPGTNTESVKINYPTNSMKFEVDTDIKLEFETTNVPLPLMYYITGKEKVSLNPFPIKASRSHHAKVLLNSIKESDKNYLPIGTYEITAHILDPSTRKEIVPPDKIIIEIIPKGAGPSGPTKIINNIIINNNINIYNVPLPFMMPVNIKIEPNPAHIKEVISHPINIQILVTKEGSSKVISVTNDILTADLEQLLKNSIPFTEEGKYNLVIILHRDKKEIIRKIVPVEIKNKTASLARNKPAPYIELDGDEIKEISDVSLNTPHKILMGNRGGGTVKWSIDYPPYINLNSSIKNMKVKSIKAGTLEGSLDGGDNCEIHFEHSKIKFDPKLFPDHILIKVLASGVTTRYKIKVI